MAHGWDSFFHNLPSPSSDPRTLTRTSESEGSLSQQLDNIIGHHDLTDTVASHESPASNTNTDYYSNSSIGNSSIDCVYQRYYRETPWPADAEQMEKDYLPDCGNGNISDLATDGSSGSFPSPFATDLQGLKQDCGMLATSFLEDLSDVSSCSDADGGETRTSCKFMSSNLVPKPKTNVSTKHHSSEWLFTHTENMFPNESLCLNMSETNAIDGCRAQKKKEDVKRDIQERGKHSEMTSGHENVTGDGIEEYPDGSEEEQVNAIAPNIITSLNNEKDHLDKKVLRKEMEASFNQENEGLDHLNSNDDQDRIRRQDEQNKSGVLKRERKQSGLLENETFDVQNAPNPNSADSQVESMEKEIKSNTSQLTDQPCMELSKSRVATDELKESSLQLPVHQSCENIARENICSSLAVISDGHLSYSSDKNEQSIASHAESCLQPHNSNADINPCPGKDCMGTAKKTNTTSSTEPGCRSPFVASDNSEQSVLQPESSTTNAHSDVKKEWTKWTNPPSPIDPECSIPAVTSDSNEKSVFYTSESCLQSNTSSTDVNPCQKKEWAKASSSPGQHQSQEQSPAAQEPQSLGGDTDENARESFETCTEKWSVLGMLYGEPLSRDSSCDSDETKLGTSKYAETSVARLDRENIDHSKGQTSQLISSKQLRDKLQPVVILKTLESVNGMSNSYRCGDCQHKTHDVSTLIEHHHCCHSVQNFQFCKTCNLYLMMSRQSERHMCGVTKDSPQPPSNSVLQKKRKRHGQHRCIKCRLTFSKLIQYISHMRTHTGKTPFKCNECGLYFAQACTLQRHKRIPGRCKPAKLSITNSNVVTSKTETLPEKEFKEITIQVNANLRKCYVKLVDISKTNLCSLCGKSFSTANEAKKHFYNLHKGKRLIVSSDRCTTNLCCEKTPKVENETKGKYKCPLCPRFFKYSYNRARHLRDCVRDSIYGGKEKVAGKYRCPLCLATFISSSNRSRHIKAFCFKDCLNRLAKQQAKLGEKLEQQQTKEIQQETQAKKIEEKTQSKENEQKKQAPLAVTFPKSVPRYKCSLCPAVFCYASGKYRHMKKHELFKLTGKMFRYRNSVFSAMAKPAALSSTRTEESTDSLKSTEESTSLLQSCRFCGKYFSTSQSMKKHEGSHRGERPYRCLECGKGFKRRAHLIGHKIVHQKRIQCTVCKKILPSIGELIQHRSSHLKRGKLQCPDCPLQFQYPVYLRRHLDVHKHREINGSQLEEKLPLTPQHSLKYVKEQSVSKQLQCSLCNEVFDDAQVLRKHCLKHISGSLSNQCPFCKHSFTSRRYLLRHMNKHTGDKPHSCVNCGKQFYRVLYLRLHSQSCLLAQNRCLVKMETNTMTKRPYKCSYCPRAFSKKIHLKNHHQGHKTNSLLLCSICGQYYGLTKLNHHQKNCGGATELNSSSLHGNIGESTFQENEHVDKSSLQSNATKMFQFKCPYCTQRFRYRSLLLRHLVSHTGVQPYACMHCGNRYRSKAMCLQHEAFCNGVFKEGSSNVKSDDEVSMPTVREAVEKKAEDEAKYKCKFCTKTFMKSRNLRHHILTHNEVKPYRCKACDSCFSRYDHLKVHQVRCKGKPPRLEVCIPKISLDDVGKGWQNRFGIQPAKKQETFDCETCSRSFPTQSKLSRHVTLFHVTKLFKCTRCGSSFSHEKTLKKHIKMKKCRKIYFKTDDSPPLETHPPRENVTEPLNGVKNQILRRIEPSLNRKYKYVCSYCPRAFRNCWQLAIHTRLHTGERPFVCDYCGQRFIRKDYLQRHFSKCTKKKQQNNVLCDRCGGLFSRVEFENHKKSCTPTPSTSKATVSQSQPSTSKTPPKAFSCAYCSSHFMLFSQLQEHFLNAHKLETLVPPVSPAPLQHHLSNIPNIKAEPLEEICDEKPADDANLICKLDTSLDNQFFCPECNTSFANKAGLAGHLRIHSTERPFNCKTCKKGFWNKNLFRNHYRKCRFQLIPERNPSQQLEVPLKAKIDFALNDSVLVFKEGCTETGTGVLQTNFSCKDDLLEASAQTSEGNLEQSNSSNKKKVVQYQCSECEKSFTDGLLLISHLEDHGRKEQEKRRNTCTKCGWVCSSPANLEKHMRMHGINQKYPCPDCPKIVYTLSDLEIHRTCHDPNRPYACKLCNQRFWTRPSLYNHNSEDHPDDVFTCHYCKKAYSTKKSLRRHYKKWHQKEQKDLVSTFQEKRSTEQQSNSQAGTGKSDEDENKGSGDSDSDSAPYFPCHVCGKTFPTSDSLEDHQRCHLGEKPHECEECGRCFFQASQLQQHQRMHKSEFQCQACGRGFVSLFALRKHKHTHGKSRPYRCSKCHFSFTGPSQLAEHMTTHREENFPCDICNSVFLSKSSRAEHRKSHSRPSDHPTPSVSRAEHEKFPSTSESSSVFTRELKYRCGVCNERFKDPEKLSEHGCCATKERPYSCTHCDKHFLHASHLKKHRTTHQLSCSIGEYPCNQCNSSFSSSQHFLSHLKTHVDPAVEIKRDTQGKDRGPPHSFICPVCQLRFASVTELIGHFPTHVDSTLECKICKMTFPSGHMLEEHEHLHMTSATEFECTESGQSFSGSNDFGQQHCSHQQHTIMESKYSNLSAKVSPPTYHQAAGEEEIIDVTGKDVYNCSPCSMQFSSKSGLLEHQNKQHRDEKPFKCKLCGKRFALRLSLKEHERRHLLNAASENTAQSTGNKQKCTHCQSKFNTAQDLSRHMRLHAEKEVGKYRCDMCYKSFSHLSLLKQHQESHVGEVVYECTECDKAFAFPHLLEEHQQIHAGSSQ